MRFIVMVDFAWIGQRQSRTKMVSKITARPQLPLMPCIQRMTLDSAILTILK